MMCNILSNEINPFVRFAQFRKHKFNDNTVFAYAKDSRFFYFTKGQCKFFIGDKIFLVNANDLIIVPPATRYRMDCTYYNSDIEYYIVNFDYVINSDTIKKPIPIFLSKPNTSLQYINIKDIDLLDHPYCTSIDGVLPYIEKISLLYSEQTFYCQSEMNSYFTLILLKIFKNILTSKTNNKILEIIKYIKINYTKNLSNIQIGAKFGYHPNYLNKMFLMYTGKTMHKYLLAYKIEKALTYISTSNLTITEISQKTGWKSVSQFSKAFKKSTGFSPVDFKTN